MCGVELVQLKVGSVPFAATHHHYRDLIFARSMRAPDTPAPACRPQQQAALSFEGLQEKGLIGFDNATLVLCAEHAGRLTSA